MGKKSRSQSSGAGVAGAAVTPATASPTDVRARAAVASSEKPKCQEATESPVYGRAKVRLIRQSCPTDGMLLKKKKRMTSVYYRTDNGHSGTEMTTDVPRGLPELGDFDCRAEQIP